VVENKRLLVKILGWIIVTPLVLVGHFYCALFMLWSASYFYKEVITMFRVLRKEKEIAYSWLDWYWYAVGAYGVLPYALHRNKIFSIESKTLQNILYQYHALISQLFILLGLVITVFKLNRGFVKYQLRRMIWGFITLGYVFMLSTV